MSQKRAGRKADIQPVIDLGEPVARMEPLLVGASSPHRAALNDRAIELALASAGLRRSLPEAIAARFRVPRSRPSSPPVSARHAASPPR